MIAGKGEAGLRGADPGDLYVITRVQESPVFEEVKSSDEVVKAPLIELLRRYPKEILLSVGTRFATDITFNVINVFVLVYATQQLGLSRGLMLNAIIIGCIVALGALPLYDWMRVTITSLEPHPNDPAPQATVSAAAGSRDTVPIATHLRYRIKHAGVARQPVGIARLVLPHKLCRFPR